MNGCREESMTQYIRMTKTYLIIITIFIVFRVSF